MQKYFALILLSLFATFFVASNSAVSEQPQLLIPVNTNFSHWDHHWIMWIPSHPVYEAIEVLSVDNPKSPGRKLIRVFFTERGTGKQVQYFSDAGVARTWRGEAYHREIDYRTVGEFGKALDLIVKFKDKNDKLVELTVQGAADQKLSSIGSGLKAQGTHAADTVFLLFNNGLNVTNPTGHLSIDGIDYSKGTSSTSEARRYQTAYSLSAHAAVISFGESRYNFQNDSIVNSWGRTFRLVPGADAIVYRSNAFGFGGESFIEVVTNQKQELVLYKHLNADHIFRISFDPALPNAETAKSGQVIRYAMSLHDAKDIVVGSLVVTKQGSRVIFDWKHDAPSWAKASSFRSTMRVDGPGGYNLAIEKIP